MHPSVTGENEEVPGDRLPGFRKQIRDVCRGEEDGRAVHAEGTARAEARNAPLSIPALSGGLGRPRVGSRGGEAKPRETSAPGDKSSPPGPPPHRGPKTRIPEQVDYLGSNAKEHLERGVGPGGEAGRRGALSERV